MYGSLDSLQTLKGHTGRIWHCAWNPTGTLLATTGEDKTIRIWAEEGNSGWKCQTILTEGHDRTIRQISWSPCGKFIASASFDGTVVIWDKSSGIFSALATLEGHENEVKSTAWSPSGSFLASCSRDKSVWVWDVADEDFPCAAVIQSHTQDVKKVKWHPQLDILASCSYDNKIKFYKEEDDDWICFATLKSHDSTVWSIDFDSTGTRIASVSEDQTLKIWQEYKHGNESENSSISVDPSWKCVCTVGGEHKRSVYDVSWCPINDVIATGCGDNAIRIFHQSNSNRGEPTFEIATTKICAHDQDVNSIAWNPKISGLLASVSDDSLLKLWKFEF